MTISHKDALFLGGTEMQVHYSSSSQAFLCHSNCKSLLVHFHRKPESSSLSYWANPGSIYSNFSLQSSFNSAIFTSLFWAQTSVSLMNRRWTTELSKPTISKQFTGSCWDFTAQSTVWFPHSKAQRVKSVMLTFNLLFLKYSFLLKTSGKKFY